MFNRNNCKKKKRAQPLRIHPEFHSACRFQLMRPNRSLVPTIISINTVRNYEEIHGFERLQSLDTRVTSTVKRKSTHLRSKITSIYTWRLESRNICHIKKALSKRVVTLRHPSKGGPVGTSSDDGIRGNPSRLRISFVLARCLTTCRRNVINLFLTEEYV